MVLHVRCSGSPYEIGQDHGAQAAPLIRGSIAFYAGFFAKTAAMDWDAVRKTALEFEPNIRSKWPELLQEMQGIADAAELELADILALNVRTEIAFGLYTDGCTALAWKTPDTVFLAQNWDWMEEQRANLICIAIQPDGGRLPRIRMMTEAGLIGKIGLNEAGVGVCLNAVRAKGMDPTRLPTHLALRVALNARSLDAARAALAADGVASSCHILVADRGGAVGMEWSALGHRDLPLDAHGRIHHTNHLLLAQPGVVDSNWLPDSAARFERIRTLTDAAAAAAAAPTLGSVQDLFKDEEGLPDAICRSPIDGNSAATLFNIVMDLGAARAEVLMGRPNRPDEIFVLSF